MIHQKTLEGSAPNARAKPSSVPPPQFENEDDDSDEEDEMPDECKDLDPDQQVTAVDLPSVRAAPVIKAIVLVLQRQGALQLTHDEAL